MHGLINMGFRALSSLKILNKPLINRNLSKRVVIASALRHQQPLYSAHGVKSAFDFWGALAIDIFCRVSQEQT